MSEKMGAVAATAMKQYTLADWRAEALRRFGSWDKVRFACPACGNVATPADFAAVRGKREDGERAAQECIGRVLLDAGKGKGVVGEWGSKQPCNWAGFGLFSTMGKGVLVRFEDGTELQAFDFAE